MQDIPDGADFPRGLRQHADDIHSLWMTVVRLQQDTDSLGQPGGDRVQPADRPRVGLGPRFLRTGEDAHERRSEIARQLGVRQRVGDALLVTDLAACHFDIRRDRQRRDTAGFQDLPRGDPFPRREPDMHGFVVGRPQLQPEPPGRPRQLHDLDQRPARTAQRRESQGPVHSPPSSGRR
jgi:hypothetical protein